MQAEDGEQYAGAGFQWMGEDPPGGANPSVSEGAAVYTARASSHRHRACSQASTQMMG